MMRRIALWMALALALMAAVLPMAGQLGWVSGTPPSDLGVRDGRLKAPSNTPNSASSQANLYPDHPQRVYAAVPPLPWAPATLSAVEALEGAAQAVQTLPSCKIVQRQGPYLRAECKSFWLGFVDDLELWANTDLQRLEVRSASRLGRKDFGVNRARVEALAALLAP